MKDQRFIIEGEAMTVRKAIYLPDFASKPNSWLCPFCKDELAHNVPYADVIQYGFEWDKHTTIVQCDGCRKLMFGTYNVWLTKRELRKRNA